MDGQTPQKCAAKLQNSKLHPQAKTMPGAHQQGQSVQWVLRVLQQSQGQTLSVQMSLEAFSKRVMQSINSHRMHMQVASIRRIGKACVVHSAAWFASMTLRLLQMMSDLMLTLYWLPSKRVTAADAAFRKGYVYGTGVPLVWCCLAWAYSYRKGHKAPVLIPSGLVG